jgi:hypothetical protein
MSKLIIKPGHGQRAVRVKNGVTIKRDYVIGPYDIRRDGKLYFRMNGAEEGEHIPEDEIYFKPPYLFKWAR